MNERGASLSCSIYNIRELFLMRETYRRTVAYAAQRNSSASTAASVAGGVTPWLALGCGDHLLPTHNCSVDETRYNEPCGKFDFATPYDPVLSWQLVSFDSAIPSLPAFGLGLRSIPLAGPGTGYSVDQSVAANTRYCLSQTEIASWPVDEDRTSTAARRSCYRCAVML